MANHHYRDEERLAHVIAAIQTLAVSDRPTATLERWVAELESGEELSDADLSDDLGRRPVKFAERKKWQAVFEQHPEFFKTYTLRGEQRVLLRWRYAEAIKAASVNGQGNGQGNGNGRASGSGRANGQGNGTAMPVVAPSLATTGLATPSLATPSLASSNLATPDPALAEPTGNPAGSETTGGTVPASVALADDERGGEPSATEGTGERGLTVQTVAISDPADRAAPSSLAPSSLASSSLAHAPAHPLTADQIGVLIETAITLHEKEAARGPNRWPSILAPFFAATAGAALGTCAGAALVVFLGLFQTASATHLFD